MRVATILLLISAISEARTSECAGEAVKRMVQPTPSVQAFLQRTLPRLPRWLENAAIPVGIGLRSASRIHSSTRILRSICNAQRPQVGHSVTRVVGPMPSFGIEQHVRGGGQVKTKRKSSISEKKKNRRKKSKHQSPLSDSDPFYPVEQIGELTLAEVGKLFDFATHSARENFDEGNFKSNASPRVLSAVDAIEKAAAKSRGGTVKASRLEGGDETTPGSIDTLHFCGAMRILTEWRMVRQVPEGYKSFAVSMKMGHKDVVKNIGKIEEAAHDYLDEQKQQHTTDIHSPTIRQLMQFEKDKGLHPELPKLKEVSGAMGLLWVRRQLNFQLAIFENFSHKGFSTSSEAFQSAYSRVYSKFHGRAVTKIFNMSLKGAPNIYEIYKCMNPKRLQELRGSPPTKELLAAVQGSNGQRGLGLVKQSSSNVPIWKEALLEVDSQGGDAVEQRISQAMKHDASCHMEAFLGISLPLLGDLAQVFEEFNMDDPKVV